MGDLMDIEQCFQEGRTCKECEFVVTIDKEPYVDCNRKDWSFKKLEHSSLCRVLKNLYPMEGT